MTKKHDNPTDEKFHQNRADTAPKHDHQITGSERDGGKKVTPPIKQPRHDTK